MEGKKSHPANTHIPAITQAMANSLSNNTSRSKSKGGTRGHNPKYFLPDLQLPLPTHPKLETHLCLFIQGIYIPRKSSSVNLQNGRFWVVPGSGEKRASRLISSPLPYLSILYTTCMDATIVPWLNQLDCNLCSSCSLASFASHFN